MGVNYVKRVMTCARSDRRRPDPDPPIQSLAAWNLRSGYRLDLRKYRGPRARFDRHHHEWSDLSIILRGQVHERVGRRETTGSSLDTTFKAAGLEHSDEFEGDVEILRLRVRPAELERAFDGGDPSLSWGWRHRRVLGRHLLRLGRDASVGAEERAIDDQLIDLLALLDSAGTSAPVSAPAWTQRLESSIEDRLTGPIEVRSLAAELGLHPVYLARVVRRVFGCSVRQLIIRKRLARAIDALRGGSASLAQVALESGFSDQSHLSRWLRTQTSLTPGGLRRLPS